MKHTFIVFVLGMGVGAFAFHYFTSDEGKANAKNAVHTVAHSAHGAIATGESAATN